MDEFDHFAVASAEGLLRTAFLLVREQQEAEDLVQECLLRVARQWSRVRDIDHQLAYARRVLINVAHDGSDRRRRRRDELGASRVDAGIAEDAGFVNLERRDELLRALGGLPFHQRAVIVLRYFDDLSEREIAEALGCSTGAVKTSASRGLSKLRATLTPSLGEEAPR